MHFLADMKKQLEQKRQQEQQEKQQFLEGEVDIENDEEKKEEGDEGQDVDDKARLNATLLNTFTQAMKQLDNERQLLEDEKKCEFFRFLTCVGWLLVQVFFNFRKKNFFSKN